MAVYTPPGVLVSETVNPSVSPLLATPASICLVGPSAGDLSRTDAVTLTGTTVVALPGAPAGSVVTIVKVVDATDPSVSEAQLDGIYPSGEGGYVFDNSGNTIRRGNSSTVIPDGNTVYVFYTYVPVDYFQAIRFDNMGDIITRFGDAYDATGTTINSELTYAAAAAFENGAQDLVLQPLFFNNGGVRQQPTDAQVAAFATWSDNFVALRDITDINVIVPIIGQSAPNVGDAQQLSIIQTVQDHIKFMKDSDQQYLVGIVGEDSSASALVAQTATLRSHAQTLAARYGGDVTQQVVFVSPASFTRALPSGANIAIAVGGQYAAAGVAGMLAARPVSQSLTRKALSGFVSVAEIRTKADKNLDASYGLLVIENKSGNLVQIRHGITLDTTSITKREISVVRAKHRVIESVRDTIETQIIGEVVADGEAPLLVNSAVIGTLEELKGGGDIVDYGSVQSRTLSLDPTTIEVRFSYRPAFPVNYVNVIFSLDLTTGDLTLADTASVDTSTF